MDCSMPGFSVLCCLPEFVQTHIHWVGDAIQPSHHLSPPFLLSSIFPSIMVFSNELALCIEWPKCWRFSFSISLSSEYSELSSFRIDWFDLLAVQGTLKSLLQHHNLKASVLSQPSLWSSSHIHTWILRIRILFKVWLRSPLCLITWMLPWNVSQHGDLGSSFQEIRVGTQDKMTPDFLS